MPSDTGVISALLDIKLGGSFADRECVIRYARVDTVSLLFLVDSCWSSFATRFVFSRYMVYSKCLNKAHSRRFGSLVICYWYGAFLQVYAASCRG